MMPSTTSLSGGQRTTTHLSLGPLYDGCVIVLTLLLVALTVCRWQSDLFRARAQLTITRTSIDSPWPTQETCEQIFSHAVSAMLAGEGTPEPFTSSNVVPDPSVADRGVSVVMDDDSTPLFLNFSLCCTTDSPDEAIYTVNMLAGQLMQSDWLERNEAFTPARIRWHMVTAKNASRHSAPLSLGMFWGCLVLSLVLSTPLLAWKRRSATLQGRDDTESLLGVPVVAQLAARAGGVLHGKPKRLFRGISSAGEWILITMLLAALAAALLDTQFARQLLGQPVTALTDGIRQLSELTRS